MADHNAVAGHNNSHTEAETSIAELRHAGGPGAGQAVLGG
jgi:hypothetical protein